MAWLFGDGFDFYASQTDFLVPGTCWAPDFGGIVPNSTTRFGVGRSCSFGNSSAALLSRNYTNSSTIYVNFAWYTANALGGASTGIYGFILRDGGVNQCGVYINGQGKIIVTVGGPTGAIIATSSVLISPFIWTHLQVKIVIGTATGSVDVRLNGSASAAFSASAIDTQNGTAFAQCNSLLWNCNTNGGFLIDDAYTFNDSGAAPNTWQGDVRAVQLMPVADVSVSWTPNSGANNYSRVNQPVEDGDTTYVFTNTPTNADLYSGASLGVSPNSIIAVQTKMYSRMDDTGPHTVKFQFQSGATTVYSSDLSLSSNYTWVWRIDTVDPNTSAAWAEAAVDAIELGPIDVL